MARNNIDRSTRVAAHAQRIGNEVQVEEGKKPKKAKVEMTPERLEQRLRENTAKMEMMSLQLAVARTKDVELMKLFNRLNKSTRKMTTFDKRRHNGKLVEVLKKTSAEKISKLKARIERMQERYDLLTSLDDPAKFAVVADQQFKRITDRRTKLRNQFDARASELGISVNVG